MTGEIVRKGVKPYGVIPFALLECHALPLSARVVAAWIEGKPVGWIVRPIALQKALGITEKQWLSARNAMIKAGIFLHQKFRRADGKWYWKSEFDLTPILSPIPPLAVHGEAANIEIREKEIRNSSKQRTEAHCTVVQTPLSPTVLHGQSGKNTDLSELKGLHIGFVLDDLEIAWYRNRDYVYWNDKFRARQAEDGHWVFTEVDCSGDVNNGGSAIDLIVAETGCSIAQAIFRLRRIYQRAMMAKVNDSSGEQEISTRRGFE